MVPVPVAGGLNQWATSPWRRSCSAKPSWLPAQGRRGNVSPEWDDKAWCKVRGVGLTFTAIRLSSLQKRATQTACGAEFARAGIYGTRKSETEMTARDLAFMSHGTIKTARGRYSTTKPRSRSPISVTKMLPSTALCAAYSHVSAASLCVATF